MYVRKSLLSNQDPWKKLDDVLVEVILARLPVADFFRSQFVCRRWKSVIRSPAFQKACQELFSRLPWFCMLNYQFPSNVVYDMEVDSWRHISLSIPTHNGVPSIPLATSNSLMCCFSGNGSFFICNPLNGSVRNIDVIIHPVQFKAIAMQALGSSYHVFVVCWKEGSLHMRIFSSAHNDWTIHPLEVFKLNPNHGQGNDLVSVDRIHVGQVVGRVYGFSLSRLQAKMLAGVTIVNSSGEVLVYYLEPRGHLVCCCNSRQKIAVVYPALIPENVSCSFDMAECRGRILMLTLMEEEVGTEVLRVWEFDDSRKDWSNIATIPQLMSQSYVGVNAIIDCTGCGDYIMVCVSSMDYNFTKTVMFNIVENTWKELPVCVGPRCGHPMRFLSAFSFMPNIEDRA